MQMKLRVVKNICYHRASFLGCYAFSIFDSDVLLFSQKFFADDNNAARERKCLRASGTRKNRHEFYCKF